MRPRVQVSPLRPKRKVAVKRLFLFVLFIFHYSSFIIHSFLRLFQMNNDIMKCFASLISAANTKESLMEIRKYKSADCAEILELFYHTVHEINIKDYTKQQLDAWATGNVDMYAWDKSFLEHNTLVAEEKKIILGFGDMDKNGYLDRLYVHKDYQRKGIATAITTELERQTEMQGI